MRTRACVVTRDAYRTWEMKRIGLAARRLSLELVILDPRHTSVDLNSGRPLDRSGNAIDIDVGLGRVDADCLEAGARLLELLEGERPILNGSQAFRTGRDKRSMSRALARAGIPHPPAWSVSPQEVPRLAPALPFPLVIKPAVGSLGRGVAIAKDPRALIAIAKERREPLYLQALCQVKRELRLLVLDGRVLGAIARRPRTGEWRGNLALGAKAVKIPVKADWEKLALEACAAIAADFAGVDLALTPDGPVILEVNVCPGFYGFSQATGIDVAQQVIHALIARSESVGVDHESAGPHCQQVALQRG